MKKITLLIFTLVFSITSYSQLANESFEAATFPPTAPAAWATFDNGVGSVNWATSAIANTGIKAALMNRQATMPAGSISKDYLATPAINAPINAQIRFFTRTTLSTIQAGTKYSVRIKPIASGAQNDPAGYAILQEWDDTNLVTTFNVYEEKVVAIPALYTGTQVYVAFVYEYTSTGALGGNRWLVDDAKVVANCLAPTLATFTAGSITNSQATFGWVAVPGTVGYQVANLLASATFDPLNPGTVGTTATNSYLQTGLAGVTAYQYYVRSDCGGGNYSPWIGPFNYTTTIAPPVCGGNFYDSGTNTSNYSNNENINTTICPAVAGQQVTVNFSAFNTEAGADLLKIYDNNSATISSLIGTYSGTTSPGSITATNPTGCLTFVFTSNGFTTASGWASTITCALPPSCQKPVALQTSVVLSTTATLSWSAIANAVSYEIFYQACGLLAPTVTAVAQATSNTNLVNLSGLSANTCYDFYVKSVCSATDFSLWSNPTSATTQTLPPVCGGNFVDNGGATGVYLINSDVTTTICPVNAGDLVTVTFTAFDTETNWDGLYVYDGNTIGAAQISSTNGPGTVPGGLPGSFWGTTIPGPFTSTAVNGCLTFRFRSDGSIVRDGWIANITCAPTPTCTKPNTLTTSLITSNSATIGWSQLPNPNNTTATLWEYVVLPSPSTPPTAAGTASNTNKPNAPGEEDREKEKGRYRKESDLEGHIEATDLKTLASNGGFSTEIEKWPLHLRNDPQIRTAFTYIKSWTRFQNSMSLNQKSGEKIVK